MKGDLKGMDLVIGIGNSQADFPAKFIIMGVPASDVCCVRVFRGGRLPKGHFELVSTHGHGLFDTAGRLVHMAEGPEDIVGIMTSRKLAGDRTEQMRLLKNQKLLNCHDSFPTAEVTGKRVALVARRSRFLHPDSVLGALRQILMRRGANEVRVCEV